MSSNAWAASNRVGAPTFKWSASEPIVGRDFAKFRNAQLAKLPRHAALEVTGLYSAAEQQAAGNPTPNLGLLRAAKISAFFLAVVPSDRIKLASAIVNDDGFTEATKKMAPFAAISFADVPLINSSQTATSSLRPRPKPIPILFPINKVTRHANAAVDAYLTKVATLLKSSGRRAKLIGYADRRGANEMNMRLAAQRAESIHAELTNLGVPTSQIDISTQSGSDMASTDDSMNGRQMGRRVEILVL